MANASDVSIDILSNDAAMTGVSVTTISRAIATIVIATVIPVAVTGTNADTNADRTRTDIHALRTCRH
jgi:hypothetical protein